MSIRFILGRAGSGKTTYLLEEIKKRVQDDEKTPVILLVPEQYTFDMEKKISNLFINDTKDKYLRARVLSFKTLSDIIFLNEGGLTDVNINSSGKAMIVYKAIESVSSDLEIFSKSFSQSGFINSITETISELKQYNVSYEMLEEIALNIENETLKLKIKDISKIYKSFEEKLHENYVDSQDLLKSLSNKIINSTYLKNAYVYIDEFTGFTPNQYNVLKNIFNQAKEVLITFTTDSINSNNDAFLRARFTQKKIIDLCSLNNIKIEKPIVLNNLYRFQNEELKHLEKYYHSYPYKVYNEKTNNIKIREFNDIYQEVEEVAKDIVKLVKTKNVRYKDITVATRDLNKYDFLISSIFSEYDIPNFIDKKREAKNNPIIILIISVLEMKSKSYSYEVMFRYLKSGLLGIDNDDINILENYVLANGIKGKKWFEEKWEYGIYQDILKDEDEYELYIKEKVNEIRSFIMKPIIDFKEKLKGKNKVKDICTYLYEFLIDINIQDGIENLMESLKQKGELDIYKEYSQVWDIVVDVLDQMVEIMGDEYIPLDKFIKVINLGFDEYELGLVPPSIDEVLVSSIDRMKNSDIKYLYLIGTIDGVFPLVSKDNSLLNDNDRDFLGKKGIELDIDTKTKTFEEQYLIYKALTSSRENLVITYHISDFEGKTIRPSIIISRLKKIFKNISLDNENNDNEIDNITSKSQAFNLLVNKIKNEDNLDELYFDLYRYFSLDDEYKLKTKKVIEGINYSNIKDKIESSKVKKLYQNTSLSISKLESYAKCPFSYFIKYGLKAKERNEYSFSSPQLGTFMHHALDEFSKNLYEDKKTWKDIDEMYINTKISEITNNILNKIPGYILKSSERYKYLVKRIKNMLCYAILIISEQIKAGEFEPCGFEVDFSKNGKYPPIKIVLENNEEIILRGQIDRIDEFENQNGKYIRIIDYKSSKKDISLSDIYYGIQLQLIVYLDAILEAEKNSYPAGIFYSTIDDPIAKFSEDKEDEEIKNTILNHLKMKGLLLNDVDIIKKMDNSLDNSKSSLIIPANIKKDGTLGKSSKCIDEEDFSLIRNYVRSLIKDLCKEMLDGNISLSPIKQKEKTSCDYCLYSSICQFDKSFNNYKVINKKTDDEILDLMKGTKKCGQNNNN